METYNRKKKEPEFDESQFIESELNKEFKQRQEELEKTRQALNLKEKDLLTKNFENEELKRREISLLDKKHQLETDLSVYEKSIKKLQYDVKRLEKNIDSPINQRQINFQAETKQKEADNLRKKLRKEIEEKIKRYKKEKLKNWQNKVWLNLFWVIPLTALCIWLVFFNTNINFIQKNLFAVRFTVGALTLILDGVLIKLLLSRYDETSKQKRMENTDVPSHLLKELEEIDVDY